MMAAQEAAQPFHWRYGELDDKNFQVGGGGSVLYLLLAFSLLLLLTLSCLYLRWACAHRHPPNEPQPGPAAGPNRRPPGLDPLAIDSIPVKLHKPAPADEDQCSICITALVEGEKLRVLPVCSHAFHPECVDEWLRARSNCPLCRAALAPPLEAQPPPTV